MTQRESETSEVGLEDKLHTIGKSYFVKNLANVICMLRAGYDTKHIQDILFATNAMNTSGNGVLSIDSTKIRKYFIEIAKDNDKTTKALEICSKAKIDKSLQDLAKALLKNRK